MQIAIEIPDELISRLQAKGKPLDVVIIEALGLYIQHDAPIDIQNSLNSTQSKVDWSKKWEQWFAECESIPISTTQPSHNDYTALLINKYSQRGLEL